MDFKIGKTCSGCDRVLKNIKKLTNASATDKIEDAVGSEVTKSDVVEYLKQTNKDAEKTSKQLVKKMQENAKVGKKGRK